MLIESGTILRYFLPAGESTPRWQPLPQTPGSTASFVPPAPGLRETLDVEGDQPAAMLVLIIEPASVGRRASCRETDLPDSWSEAGHAVVADHHCRAIP